VFGESLLKIVLFGQGKEISILTGGGLDHRGGGGNVILLEQSTQRQKRDSASGLGGILNGHFNYSGRYVGKY
jgi:hypothetical protein